MSLSRSLVVVLSTSALALACRTTGSGSQLADAGSGLANPASTACINAGGIDQIVATNAGQIGLCSFGSGEIEEWTLTKGTGTQAAQAFASAPDASVQVGAGGANPASVYCGAVGGTDQIITTSAGQSGLCTFPDNSAIEEWTLFRGANDPGNAALNAALTGVGSSAGTADAPTDGDQGEAASTLISSCTGTATNNEPLTLKLNKTSGHFIASIKTFNNGTWSSELTSNWLTKTTATPPVYWNGEAFDQANFKLTIDGDSSLLEVFGEMAGPESHVPLKCE